MQCDSVFEAAQELVSANPIVNVYRDQQFAEKKAEYFGMFPAKLANFARLLDAPGAGPFFLGAVRQLCVRAPLQLACPPLSLPRVR
jgi:hypothetical protein